MKALLLIDIQNGLTKKKALYKEQLFIDTVNAAIKTYRDSGSIIVFVQHNNNQLKNGTPDWEIDQRLDRQENDLILQKKHANVFQKTDLKTRLTELGINSITIGGLVSHGCVKVSCMGGMAEGFEISVLKNGHTNWNRDAVTKIEQTEEELLKSGIKLEEVHPASANTDSTNSLHELTTAELGQLFPIIISEYSDKWPDLYESEKDLIINSFAKSDIVRIDHIGSTALPLFKAKPTIDILVQISEQADPQKIIDTFKALGYQYTEQADNPPPHMMFVKGYSSQGFSGQAYHVHVRYKGDWDEIRFRDYLLRNKDVAKEYEMLKLKLADKFRNDREAYTDSKTEFIEKINKLTLKDSVKKQTR